MAALVWTDLVSPAYAPWQFMLAVDDVNYDTQEIAALSDDRNTPAVINLSSGINSCRPPEQFVSFVVRTASHPWFWDDRDGPRGHVIGRAAVAACESVRGDRRLPLGIDNVIVTAGASAALTMAAHGLRRVMAGEETAETPEAVVPVPTFSMAGGCLTQAGFKIVELASAEAHRWLPSVDEVIGALTPATRVLYINTFNNPSGELYDATELRRLVICAMERGITILHDTVSSDISCAEPIPHLLSIADAEHYLDGVVTVGSMSKARAIPGFRVGWLIAKAGLVRQFARLNDIVAPSSPAIASPALLVDRMATSSAYQSDTVEDRSSPEGTKSISPDGDVTGLIRRQIEPYHAAFPGLEAFMEDAAESMAAGGTVSALLLWRRSLRETLAANAGLLTAEFSDLVSDVPQWHGDFNTFVQLPALHGYDYLKTTYQLFHDYGLQTLPAPAFGHDAAWWSRQGYFTRLSFALPEEEWAEGLQRLRHACGTGMAAGRR
ncbi:pyridoxal phosphate-dependent aminotransferase [Actinomadura sp. DC4]|uniref:pyridoxal phosphate-dependent aminotransferase n=1 Tax=Actinomadura sp. DC4 TaxID=3055069 RepID=UPI0025B22598|nr:pyridoxal phosphate-dependent aminotransferase [Actinomadura sp. DC4]MDN3358513.1 pyridoxal phosphate-dependent aminotransferase [Actinomadura sp. DC4]